MSKKTDFQQLIEIYRDGQKNRNNTSEFIQYSC